MKVAVAHGVSQRTPRPQEMGLTDQLVKNPRPKSIHESRVRHVDLLMLEAMGSAFAIDAAGPRPTASSRPRQASAGRGSSPRAPILLTMPDPALDPTLTQRQMQILDFIRDGVRSRGFPPSIREIGAALGVASTSTVHSHLRQLEEKGYIRRDPARPRCIELVGAQMGAPPQTRVADDDDRVGLYPLLETLEGGTGGRDPMNIPLPRDLVGGDDGFLFQVEGDSMRDAGILHGDLVIARRRDEAEDGDIVVAVVNQDVTVKRFFNGNGVTRLESDNRRMKPIFVRDARVLGKVVGLIRRIY